MARVKPTPERVRELLDYDPETGIFRWRIDRAAMKAGDVAGGIGAAGYWMIGIDMCRMYGHVLAWMHLTGEHPPSLLDHEDTDRLNNRWTNIRAATHSQNSWNMKKPPRNTSGYKGVSKHTKNEKWCAFIRINGKSKYLGSFSDPHDAYVSAAKDNFGEFARAQ
jgi:hypothetical protein